LDEVGDIPSALQPKVAARVARTGIRAFRERSHAQSECPAGSGNQSNLGKMVARQQFRSDLYYRLNIFPILLPALRERREDIPALVTHFVKMFSRRMGKQVDSIPPETMAASSGIPGLATFASCRT